MEKKRGEQISSLRGCIRMVVPQAIAVRVASLDGTLLPVPDRDGLFFLCRDGLLPSRESCPVASTAGRLLVSASPLIDRASDGLGRRAAQTREFEVGLEADSGAAGAAVESGAWAGDVQWKAAS